MDSHSSLAGEVTSGTLTLPQRETAAAPGLETAADAPPTARLLVEAADEVIVRMYRQGLGDCFLLALPAADLQTKYVLVDCGMHSRQTAGTERLAQVMEHLAASTGSRIDVVVATHEHADHLSGFVQKGSPFLKDDLTIGEAWLAWTEKQGDQQADALRKKRGAARELIERAVEEARRLAGAAGTEIAEQLLHLTDFENPAEDSVDAAAVTAAIDAIMATRKTESTGAEPAVASEVSELGASAKKAAKKAPKKPSSNELALSLLVAKAGQEHTQFCEPGSIHEIAGVSDFRAYVLGPPRSDLLDKDKPTKIRGSREGDADVYKEVYLCAAASNRALELSPRLAGAERDAGLPDWQYPFASQSRRDCDFSAPVGTGEGSCWSKDPPPEETRRVVEESYLTPAAAWRRIDGDWLAAAEQLALNLGADTNNTSLVLAFEWGAPGRGAVMLFAADAQVGNWLSWRDQDYGERKMAVDELLARVLLYKVGHHGSHNATLRRDPRRESERDPFGAPFGLELMGGIVAMIPVDWDAARKKMPDPWRMPHEPLYRRLRELADRRVMRSDEVVTPLDPERDGRDLVPGATDWQQVPGMAGVRWRRSKEVFTTGTPGPLYYDVAITRRA